MAVTVELIYPGRINFTPFYKAVRGAVERTQQYVLRAYAQTTAKWTHPVRFDVKRGHSPGCEYFEASYTLVISTEDAIYHWIDAGTEGVGAYGGRYVIQPRQLVNENGRPTTLRFQGGYTPSTRPGKLDSHASQRYGDVVYTPTVLHPGIKARGFSPIIADRAYRRLEQELARRVVDEGLRQSMTPLVS